MTIGDVIRAVGRMRWDALCPACRDALRTMPHPSAQLLRAAARATVCEDPHAKEARAIYATIQGDLTPAKRFDLYERLLAAGLGMVLLNAVPERQVQEERIQAACLRAGLTGIGRRP